MRSLLAAVLSLFLPPRGAHRASGTPTSLTVCPPAATHRRTRPHATDVVLADGLPLVRPYLAVWERERDERDRRRLQRERHPAAVLATPAPGQDHVLSEVAA